MGHTISRTTVIEASPETVWGILTDFAAYPGWNPFIVAIQGVARQSARLTVTVRPPGSKPQTFKPIVQRVEPPHFFSWRGSLPIPGLFIGEHSFRLTRRAIYEFAARGELLRTSRPVLQKMLARTEEGFNQMNAALKARAEAQKNGTIDPMSVRRLDPISQPALTSTTENLSWAREQIAKYPEGRQWAAVIPLLWRAQEQHDGWLPEPAIRYVADMLEMPYIRAYEIATFYTMFNLSPVGKYYVQLCGTTPCMLRGAEEIKDICLKQIGPEKKVSADGMLSWMEVECLGACVNAPMIQINKDYFEDLTPDSLTTLLSKLRSGVA